MDAIARWYSNTWPMELYLFDYSVDSLGTRHASGYIVLSGPDRKDATLDHIFSTGGTVVSPDYIIELVP